jgi:probable addiction module antidote protein
MEQQRAKRKADAALFRDNPDAIAAYLADAFDKNDLEVVLKALSRVMLAQNVQAMAREGGLRRDRLYKTFNGDVEPPLGRIMALCNALGVRLTIRPLPVRKVPLRPKLGRPRKVRS